MSDIGRNPEEYLAVKVSDGVISKNDADTILEHLNEASSNKGMSEHTTVSNLRYIAHAVMSMPDIRTWTNQMISIYVSKVRKRYKVNTQRKHIILTKRFASWLVSTGKNTSINIDKVKEIDAPAANRMTKTSAQMLRGDDITKIITAGRNTRDRCMLAILAESGMRPFELLDLTWGELQIDDKGVVVNISGKTGTPRFIRLVSSTPYIAAWRNDHPDASGKHHIFVSLKGGNVSDCITHSALKKVVRLAAARAGVKQHVNPYVFRHSNVTRMMEEGYSDSTIRMVHWGSQTTSMLGTYGHVSAGAVDKEILERAGIVRAEQKEKKVVDQCIRCFTILTPKQPFCPSCGMPQNEDAREEAKMFMNDLKTMPISSKIEMIEEYLSTLKSQK